MENNTLQEKEVKKEAFLIHLFSIIKLHWIAISVSVVTIVVLTSIYVFSLPRTYNSETILLPETSSSSTSISGNLGAMASMAGIKLGGSSSDDAIYPEFYPKVLGSTVFLSDLLKDTVNVSRLKKKATIYAYFRDCGQQPWWGKMMSKKKETPREEALDNENINPIRPNKKQKGVMDALSNALFCVVDKKTDMITVSVTVEDADVAQQIAANVCNRLQKYITDYRTGKARKDLNYAKKITQEAHNKYLKAQHAYAAYCDANMDVTLVSYRQVADRLENEMQLAYNTYSQYAQQMQIAESKVQERTPVYTVIQPATVPLKPIGPKRMFSVAIALFLSFFGSLTFLLARDYWKNLKAKA